MKAIRLYRKHNRGKQCNVIILTYKDKASIKLLCQQKG